MRRRLAGLALLAAAACAAEPPSLELIEFLADWSVGEGEWLDPAALEETMPVPERVQQHDPGDADAQAD